MTKKLQTIQKLERNEARIDRYEVVVAQRRLSFLSRLRDGVLPRSRLKRLKKEDKVLYKSSKKSKKILLKRIRRSNRTVKTLTSYQKPRGFPAVIIDAAMRKHIVKNHSFGVIYNIKGGPIPVRPARYSLERLNTVSDCLCLLRRICHSMNTGVLTTSITPVFNAVKCLKETLLHIKRKRGNPLLSLTCRTARLYQKQRDKACVPISEGEKKTPAQ
jgi:hypothetical protein